MKDLLGKIYHKLVKLQRQKTAIKAEDIEHTLELYREFDIAKYRLYHELLKTEQILKNKEGK